MNTSFFKVFPEISSLYRGSLLFRILTWIVAIFFGSYMIGYTAGSVWGLFN